jgi:hypothetical protein
MSVEESINNTLPPPADDGSGVPIITTAPAGIRDYTKIPFGYHRDDEGYERPLSQEEKIIILIVIIIMLVAHVFTGM